MYTNKRTKITTYISGIRKVEYQKRFLKILWWRTTGTTYTNWADDPTGDIETVICVQSYYGSDRVDLWDRLPISDSQNLKVPPFVEFIPKK